MASVVYLVILCQSSVMASFLFKALLFFYFSTAWAQPEIESPAALPFTEKLKSFIGLQESIMVQALLEAPFTYLYLGAPDIRGVVYAPSFAPRLGARVAWRSFGSTLTFALPIPKGEQVRRGTSSQTSMVLSSYWRKDAIDLFYQKFRSFYVSSPGRELSIHKPERYPQLPEAALRSFGVNWYHAFRDDDYSLRAAFDFTELQLRSGGSWLINPFFSRIEVSLGNAFLPGIGDDSITEIPNLASARFETLGATLGYGHTFIKGPYFISVLGGVGPGIQVQHIQNIDGGDNRAQNIAWKVNVNGSVGWNSPGYVGGMKLLFDSLSSRVAGKEVATNLVSGQLFWGGRF